MKILLLDTGREWGGGTNSLLELLKRVDRNRFDITVLYYEDVRKGRWPFHRNRRRLSRLPVPSEREAGDPLVGEGDEGGGPNRRGVEPLPACTCRLRRRLPAGGSGPMRMPSRGFSGRGGSICST